MDGWMADEWIQLTMVHGRVYNNDEIVMEWVVASGKKNLEKSGARLFGKGKRPLVTMNRTDSRVYI